MNGSTIPDYIIEYTSVLLKKARQASQPVTM